MQEIPFVLAKTPAASSLVDKFQEVEFSGIYSNYGPKNTQFEAALQSRLFGSQGCCLTVCNATIGLMTAMKQAARKRPRTSPSPRYALMPAFTFAAAAHAALWAGFTPLFCDIDAGSWGACPQSERRLIAKYGSDIDLIVPYATFGNNIDLDHYERLHRETGAGIVVDAAASLGAIDERGRGFGTGFRHPVVYSMHATKTFGVGEGGVIYCADPDTIATLRIMGNFGFGEPRCATMPGLNSKMTEMTAVVALECLKTINDVSDKREMLADAYRRSLISEFKLQSRTGRRTAYQFMPLLLPKWVSRDAVRASLSAQGIGTGAYFSPHLMQQPYFRAQCEADDLTVTDDVGARILSLPLWTDMTTSIVERVVTALHQCVLSNPADQRAA
ncbi:DegT/DnrJ/EryC1/StrS family aminotransferase [Neoasaia chiangmaiensis]|uniref:Aminotransferase DegT n=1 Tax=Neoasaia chiangmaiensis TaxID=320497 RepID=A0A1U9KSF3_9PROT|nr:DegT/DnrJ/EryC1/StrS family aminotransferase [Neoasaia chiangmaiensis]AQS88738.1 hypothetical protein A0U93_13335 [Neoasaia chiangmaiensis]